MVTVSEAVAEISQEEIQSVIDREAQARIGLSGAELLRRYRSGELDDPDRVADLIVLADLLKDAA